MEQQPQTYRIIWCGIQIEAIYTPRKWGIVAYLEIRSIAPQRAPLPVTGTGYLSYFHRPDVTEREHGCDVVALVMAWLNRESANREWRAYVDANRQLSLF